MPDHCSPQRAEPASADVTLRRAWAVASPAVLPLPAWLGADAAGINRDEITGLPDRRSFGLALAAAEAATTRGDWAGYGVLALDLDRFKAVNDRLGHAAGDVLLRAAAERIARGLREGDIAARIGGDEFAVLLAPPVGEEAAGAIAARVIERLALPFTLGGRTALIGASAGVALSDAEERSGAGLLRRADLALVQAKADGRARWRAFDAGMQSRMAAHRKLEHDLRDAAERGELRLLYRPQRNVSGALTGQEALLRWDRPGHGLLLPSDFLPVAEEAGLAGPIGAWMLGTACLEASRWPDAGVTLTVAISEAQLAGGALIVDVTRALAGSGLPPERLEVGVPEAALARDAGQALAQFRALRDIGIRVSLTEFGGGHGSLTILRAFPFNRVTVDRRLERALSGDAAGRTMLRALAMMGGETD
jgi:diguanylate cyclase (GGDEF)-like protein